MVNKLCESALWSESLSLVFCAVLNVQLRVNYRFDISKFLDFSRFSKTKADSMTTTSARKTELETNPRVIKKIGALYKISIYQMHSQ